MRLFFTLLFLFVFGTAPFSKSAAKEAEPVPITVGDVENYKKLKTKERFYFIADYYLKNKENGVTDEMILNELLKVFNLTEEQAQKVKKLTAWKEQYQYLKSWVKSAIDEANLTILERNPGRTDMTIDPDQPETWENIKNIYIGKKKIEDYYRILKGNSYFSETVVSENISAFLSSCADTGKESIPMSVVLFPQGNRLIVTREEGEPADGIHIDFSGSENIETGSVLPPMEKSFRLNGKNVLGYEGKVYLPFMAKLKNPQEAGTVRLRMNVKTCLKDDCRTDVLPEMVYKTGKSEFESSFCQNIIQAVNVSPKNGKASLKLKKAFFKKEKSGDVFLMASFKLPMLAPSKISYLIKNERGLHFSSPVPFQNGRNFLIKARLLNPEKLKDKTPLTFDVGYVNATSEFKVDVSVENNVSDQAVSFVSFSFSGLIGAFFDGLKFFILTPVLLAFFLLLTQAMLVSGRTADKTYEFAAGLFKAFLLFGTVFLVFFGLNSVFRFAEITWGRQFDSPMLDFIFMGIFCLVAIGWKIVFDDEKVERVSRCVSFFFDRLHLHSSRAKAGMIAGTIVGGLLLITPMTALYYGITDRLIQSVLFNYIAFLAGMAFPFLIVLLFCEKAACVDDNPNAMSFMKLIVSVPLCFQLFFLWLSIGVLTGLSVFAGVGLLTLAVGFSVWKRKAVLKKALVVALFAGLCFIPFSPSGKGMTGFLSNDFDESLLRRRVEDGKSVYLNVSEDFCWLCLWNRFLVSYKGNVGNDELTIMKIGYDNPFLKQLLFSDALRTLPMNVFFSSAYPEGKIVDFPFDVWSVQKVMDDALPAKEIEPFEQIELEQKKPDPEGKDTD